MKTEGSRDREIAEYSFLVVFANDGLIDHEELAMIKRLALEDHIISEEEKEVLHNIFSRVDPERTDPGVLEEIRQFRKEYGID